MPNRPIIVTLDVDRDSLASLRDAFPEGRIEALDGASTKTLGVDWDPGAADLLVVGASDRLEKTLGLCRGLRGQAGRARTPLIVLVQAAQGDRAARVLAAGADSCLVLPVHPKDLVSTLARARAGNQPGRHTLGFDRAQRENPWQDDGGEA